MTRDRERVPTRMDLLAFSAVLTCALWAAPVLAQMVTGTIAGSVTDPTGARVPDAQITVRNLETNFMRTVPTDASGNYVVPNLPTGTYEVIAEKAGFAPRISTGLRLEADQRTRVDIQLSVGEVAELMEVAAAAPLLRSQSSELGEVVAERQVLDLPLSGRNFAQLVTLTAGTGTGMPGQSLHGNSPSAFRSNTAVSGSAGRADQNNFLLDGVDNNEADVNTIVIIPIVDAIQEFKVLTNNFSAEYGRSAGMIVSVQTKSGTNQLRGSAFEYHRNAALDARNFFDPPGDQPVFIQNQFGGTAGGPIRTNRAFFFTAYQGTRVRQGQTYISTVPTARMRQGDFGELGRPIFNPITRLPFPGNMIPTTDQDPAAARLMQTFPLPNRPGLVDNYINAPVMSRRDDQFDIRIDAVLSQRSNVFGRYSFGETDRFLPSRLTGTPAAAGGEGFTGLVGALSGAGDANVRTQGLALNHTFVISPALLNETRVGYTRFRLHNVPEGYGQNLADQFGIPGINVSPLTTGLPRIQIAGAVGLGPASFLPDFSTQNTYQVLNNFTWIAGGHTLKFGGDFRRRLRNNYEAFNQQGSFLFTPQFTTYGLSDFLTGYPTTTLRTLLHGFYEKQSWELAGYVQDDYTATRRLTLNLGVRYEIWRPVVEREDRQANFDPATARMIVAGPDQPLGRGLRHFNRANFGPRLGFAYDLLDDGRTILRGGYGISHLEDGGQVVTLNMMDNFPFAVTQVIPTFGAPANRLSQGLSVPQVPAPTVVPAGNVKGIDPDFQPAYTHMAQLSVQRQLTDAIVLDVAYAGNWGRRLRNTRNINQPLPGPGPAQTRRPFFALNPALNTVTVAFSDGRSSYNSLQVKLNQRFAGGLTFMSSYTLSRTMSDSEGALGLCADAGPQNPYDPAAEWSLSCTHVPHRFVTSYAWELPFGRDLTGLARALGTGWQVNGIFSARAGSPFTPSLSTPQPIIGSTVRPDRICDGTLPAGERSATRWFDTSCFVFPSDVYGNAGRNILKGPALVNFDASAFKHFSLGGDTRLQLRAEVFNVFNRAHFQLPVRFVDTDEGGRIRETISPGRQVQLALRVSF